MAFSDHKIQSFAKKLTDLPDQPNLSAAELKAYFDSSPEELRQAHNALCTDAERLDNRVSGIVAETFGDTITEHMLDPDFTQSLVRRSDLYSGIYTGDGIYPREITLGFSPQLLFLIHANGVTNSPNYAYHFLAFQKEDLTKESYCQITENGFCLNNEGDARNMLNTKGGRYKYLALK